MSIRIPRFGLHFLGIAVVLAAVVVLASTATPASAQELPPELEQDLIDAGDLPADGTVVTPVPGPDAIPDLTVTVGDEDGGSSQPLTIVLVLTMLALAPTLLIMLTAFTRTIIVLGITRNALSL